MKKILKVAKLREQFPVTGRYAYLNHASVGGLSQPVVGAMTRYLTERAVSGGEVLLNWDDDIERIRQTCARFIGAHRDEIVFTGSISHGLNIVACGLDWTEGDNLICAETEFPANIYPWTNLQRRGVEVRFAPVRENRILVKDVASLMDSRTRLVALSLVEFHTGFRNDLDALADLCHGRDVLLCVDGIQGLGALQFSVAKTPVDFVAAHSAKWMLGPIGAGFLYVRRELLQALNPAMAGWRSIVDREDYFKYDSPLRQSGERFEPGSPNFAGLLGMEAAMELLLSVGMEDIEARILALTDYLIAGLQEQGCAIATPIGHRSERSGIVSFRHPDITSTELCERLHAADVIVSMRGNLIRVSPHFYNTEQDLDQLLTELPR
ncbi:MAG: aminotransferase class V-fold PLP-dependent enzyme [Anaerolineae bacterium]|jgi:selenocysteine lyase/cysteine desulfurase